MEKLGGVQPKFTADVSADGTSLVPSGGVEEGRFIVKPPAAWKRPRSANSRRHLPKREPWDPRRYLAQNEHLSMCLARLLGIEVAPCALLSMMDGIPVYVTKRFDRTEDDPPRRRHQLDFCQLLNLPQEQKAAHPATRCIEVIVEHSVDAGADLEKLFRLLVFSYWIGNGDLHLKNFSLLDRGGYRLSPAYDLACSYVCGDQKLALPVRARQKDVPRALWLAFAAECRLDEDRAGDVIDSMLARHEDCREMIRRSGLPEEYRCSYLQCLTKRHRALRAS